MANEKGNKMPTVYVCYPFDVKRYYNHDSFQKVIMAIYKLGFHPVVAEPNMIYNGNETMRRHMCSTLVSLCDGLVICYEEAITEIMLMEIELAKQLNKPVARLIFNKGIGEMKDA